LKRKNGENNDNAPFQKKQNSLNIFFKFKRRKESCQYHLLYHSSLCKSEGLFFSIAIFEKGMAAKKEEREDFGTFNKDCRKGFLEAKKEYSFFFKF